MKIFDTLDSTNLHAMRMIGEGMSVHGDVIITKHQSQGKGQRDKQWEDVEGHSLLMTIILHNCLDKMSITDLNRMVALSVVSSVEHLTGLGNVFIKWPNDIYIENKKVCGILIENGFKGSLWTYAVIGIGINLLQREFSDELIHATSLLLASGKHIDALQLGKEISNSILESAERYSYSQGISDNNAFHQKLYKLGEWVDIMDLSDSSIRKLFFHSVDEWGRAVFVNENNEMLSYNHGSISWII